MSKPQGTVRPLGLAVVLAIGFGAVFAVAAVWAISIWAELYMNRGYEHVVVRTDGTPLIEQPSSRMYGDVTFRALDGKEVPCPKGRTSRLEGALPRHAEPGRHVSVD